MAVSLPIPQALPAAPPPAELAEPQAAPRPSGPACAIDAHSGATPLSLWHLGIEAQEITSAIALLADQLDSDDESTRSAAIEHLESALLAEEHNKDALTAKADATCWVIEHLRAQSAYRQQQARRLTTLARGDASRADALETTLIHILTRLQPTATRFSFPHHELTSRRSQAVEIDNEDLLGPEWLTVKTTTAPDKTAIKAALKLGHTIPGATLLSRRTWHIH
jgi:hypothetical protein